MKFPNGQPKSTFDLLLEMIPIGMACTLLGFVGGCYMTAAPVMQEKKEMKAQAIQRGYAEYNATNGTWQWKEQAK